MKGDSMKLLKMSMVLLSLICLLPVQAEQKRSTRKLNAEPKEHIEADQGSQLLGDNLHEQLPPADSHNSVVTERDMTDQDSFESTVDTRLELAANGDSVIKTMVTHEPLPEEGKVVETTDTWTWSDYAKVAILATLGLSVVLMPDEARELYSDIQSYFKPKKWHEMSLQEMALKIVQTPVNEAASSGLETIDSINNTRLDTFVPNKETAAQHAQNFLRAVDNTPAKITNFSLNSFTDATIHDVASVVVGASAGQIVGGKIGSGSGKVVGATLGATTGLLPKQSVLYNAGSGYHAGGKIGKLAGAAAGAIALGALTHELLHQDPVSNSDKTLTNPA